jgi:hypothetical protein
MPNTIMQVYFIVAGCKLQEKPRADIIGAGDASSWGSLFQKKYGSANC